MGGWVLRVVWPIEDDALFDHEAKRAARRDLPNVARDRAAVICGRPKFTVVDVAPGTPLPREWPPATTRVVVCEVPAKPAPATAGALMERRAA